ncbi:hypothetical protein SAMN02745121_05761 [Nannocystis exedens]|uniref:Uncharacterized protein n=1 Tax=Nannocystis exedens TaxID=54 RepID=A0A1I2DY78_9BACT|nr:hypothetical protein [Nannocystis exedens]PCC69113.1 hypothetical protein NAEX_02135 [Nannocystis exedens]SFE84920.1 hypothetical protein SAMN02745121_05761 [Nannocystis exedens]
MLTHFAFALWCMIMSFPVNGAHHGFVGPAHSVGLTIEQPAEALQRPADQHGEFQGRQAHRLRRPPGHAGRRQVRQELDGLDPAAGEGLRSALWTVLIFAVEYVAGAALCRLTGRCPLREGRWVTTPLRSRV